MSPHNEEQVWLITGCSQGLGFELCKAVLAAGHKLIASSRDPSKTPESVSEVQSLGGAWVKLDVTAAELETQLETALSIYGQIDVLVNNAGVAMGGALEDFNADQAHQLFETNFFGPLRLITALAPHMRSRKSGTIINIGSGAAWRPVPGIALYAASKAAINSLTECLAAELAGFGVRVLLLVPGDIRTTFIAPERQAETLLPLSDPYKGTMVDHVLHAILALHGNQPIDPTKLASRMVEMVDGTGTAGQVLSGKTFSRIPIGKDSAEMMRKQAQEFGAAVEALEPIWGSVDF